MFSTTIQVTFLKAIFLILVAVLCALAVLIVSGEREASQSRRLHYIPRYLSEKEIRGPTYHVHHRMFENKGSESIQRVVHWVNVGNPVTRKVRIVARMGHLIGDGTYENNVYQSGLQLPFAIVANLEKNIELATMPLQLAKTLAPWFLQASTLIFTLW